jgi:hypothetical protein
MLVGVSVQRPGWTWSTIVLFFSETVQKLNCVQFNVLYLGCQIKSRLNVSGLEWSTQKHRRCRLTSDESWSGSQFGGIAILLRPPSNLTTILWHFQLNFYFSELHQQPHSQLRIQRRKRCIEKIINMTNSKKIIAITLKKLLIKGFGDNIRIILKYYWM